jgi:hypothetical protein
VNPTIRVLVTGGTFDKEYDELGGRLFFKDTHLPEMLRLARCRIPVQVETLMMIDSLDMTEALPARQGARTSPDQLVDKLSRALHARRGKVTAATAGPAVSAVLVRINVELGLAPEPMRATLQTARGQQLLDDGLRTLGAHLVGELLK